MKALIFKNIVVDVRSLEYETHPDYFWVDCIDDCVSGWLYSEGVLYPSDDEIGTDNDNTEILDQVKDYIVNRQSAYPPIGDQLDALFHAGVFPEEMAAQLKAVKDQFPKE